MPDDRVDEIRVHLKVARGRVMRAARAADTLHASTCHQRLMLAADAIDDASEAIEGTAYHLQLIQESYDADSVDIERRERARRRFGGRQ
jgi:hypothetical protein